MSKVDLTSVIEGVKAKLNAERGHMAKLLSNSQTIRDFQGMAQCLLGIQASVRALDILTGRCDLDGNLLRAGEESLSTVAADEAQLRAE